MKTPEWNNLITGNCPKCEDKMVLGGTGLLDDTSFVKCVRAGCNFKIGMERMSEIINNLTGRKRHGRPQDNMEILNSFENKGHRNL